MTDPTFSEQEIKESVRKRYAGGDRAIAQFVLWSGAVAAGADRGVVLRPRAVRSHEGKICRSRRVW